MSFIDDHRKELGIEPICRELRVAPSSYYEHAARLVDPDKRSVRARRDDELRQQFGRVHEASFGLYGTRKVWHQLRREGIEVAKCTVERLMRAMGLAGIRRGKTCVTTVSNPKTPCPLTGSTASSRSPGLMRCGSSTSPMSIPGPASSTSPS